MAEVRINENGELENVETGQVIGKNINGSIVLDSSGAKMMTLDDYGVKEPTETPEEYEEAFEREMTERKAREDEENAKGKEEGPRQEPEKKPAKTTSSSVKKNASQEEEPPSKQHMDIGDTSFNIKRTKYEVTPETYFTVRFGLVERKDGGYYTVGGNELADYPEAEPHWVKFRMWTYDEELRWKAEFMEFNAQSKTQYINIEKLNERKIKRLLLDWSFGEMEDRLKLLHCDGRLSDESYSMFRGLYPVIANRIVDMMNSVLENL